MTEHCEWCEEEPVVKFKFGDYERFACAEHERAVRLLCYIDHGVTLHPIYLNEPGA